MSSKINVAVIVRDHVHTLRDTGKDHVSWRDIVTFYALPLLLAPVPAFLCSGDLRDFATVIVEAFAVLTALLLNLQALIVTRVRTDLFPDADDIEGRINKEKRRQRHALLQQISQNISYEILIALFVVVVFIFAFVFVWMPIFLFGFYFVAHFVVTALMILKRFHILMTTDLANEQ